MCLTLNSVPRINSNSYCQGEIESEMCNQMSVTLSILSKYDQSTAVTVHWKQLNLYSNNLALQNG